MALTREAKSKLIEALSTLRFCTNPDRCRDLVDAAVRDAKYGLNFLGGLVYDGAPRDRARHIVVQAENAGDPPGDILIRILLAVLPEVTDRAVDVVLNAAIERLLRPGTPVPGAAEAPEPDPSEAAAVDGGRPDGPLVMVSFSHGDFDEVSALVAQLRARGVNATWDQDQRPGSNIPTWVVSTYQRADWVVLACSPSYGASVARLMKDPVHAPSKGKGVAQEVRLMCSEDLHFGPARLVPAMLPGGTIEHAPLVAHGQLWYRVPEQLDALAEALKRPGPRATR